MTTASPLLTPAPNMAPEFSARSDDGRTLRLSELRGKWVILFFYPRAGSPGCSIEARRFEAKVADFDALNAQLIGVSLDTEARQAKFRDSCGLSYPLIPDGDRTLSKAYGVIGGLGGLLGMAARETFLIAPDGTLARHWRTVNPANHASDVLKDLQTRSCDWPKA
ncbi:peroxiredoxin [Deinococcus puniceus]|uniref:thioredoxin-dependent peroxiredoxin n=1 Tax=Deinococcus puniceus TaxID=1182568 RepID=A0A172T830_9DEIO|nr:peroxiredoxin [Deinococcus puniceus]ANE43140.1 alkyl hydroperoxide reductase [Deinococcus puniceus]